MTRLSITARFPLGVFQGHAKDGSIAELPDTARLYSALVNAAGSGTAADSRGGRLVVSDASATALTWLEAHPPAALMIPDHARFASGLIAYRNQGVLKKLDPKTHIRDIDIASRATGGATALAGALGWLWPEVPDEVAETVARLCADVSCLGETDSPVILETGPIEITHCLVAHPSQLHPRGIAVRTPAAGRLDALQDIWSTAHPKKLPTSANDAVKSKESTKASSVPTKGLRNIQYERPAPPPPPEPWPSGILLPIVTTSRRIRADDVVAWCTALHRMLVARMAPDVPSSITGHRTEGAARPANNIAIQYIAPGLAPATRPVEDFPHGALLLMLPRDLPVTDRARLIHTLDAPHLQVWSRTLGRLHLGRASGIDLRTFWPQVQPGWHRTWRSLHGLVPETRRQPSRPNGDRWDFERAALLSLFHVGRDRFDPVPARDYWSMTDVVSATENAPRVLATRRIPDSRVERYVHRIPDSLGVVQPYEASLDLGNFITDRALLAIGQSRHLGGGLLVPVDTPEEP